jgi:hypothetical protein
MADLREGVVGAGGVVQGRPEVQGRQPPVSVSGHTGRQGGQHGGEIGLGPSAREVRRRGLDREPQPSGEPAEDVLLDLHRGGPVGPDGEVGVVNGGQDLARHRLLHGRGVEVPEVAGMDGVDRPRLEHPRHVVHELGGRHRLREVVALQVGTDLQGVGDGLHRKVGHALQVRFAPGKGLTKDGGHGSAAVRVVRTRNPWEGPLGRLPRSLSLRRRPSGLHRNPGVEPGG